MKFASGLINLAISVRHVTLYRRKYRNYLHNGRLVNIYQILDYFDKPENKEDHLLKAWVLR